MSAPFLVQGMGLEPVVPDWPPLTIKEARRVLSRVMGEADAVTLEWHSLRPFSALAIVRARGAGGEQRLVVKRHHRRVRDVAGLEEEHHFISHLAARGVRVPKVVGAPLRDGDYVYEAHEVLGGHDEYRDALSWTPYRSEQHAAAAGAARGRLHGASAGYRAPKRRPAPLLAGTAVLMSSDPVLAVSRFARQRPGLGEFLSGCPWAEELGEALIGMHHRFSPYAAAIEPLWGHNDWHPSNLLWSCEGERPGPAAVTGVIDFGLCNFTWACYDVATAIERTAIGWLEPAGRRPIHLDHVAAFLYGYSSARPLDAMEKAALPHLLPIVHVEYALSEIDYFHSVVGSESDGELAYEGYLLGHLRWFATPDGADFCAKLARLVYGPPPESSSLFRSWTA